MTDEVIRFEATLYFDERPAFDFHKLVESWGKEGYTCERVAPNNEQQKRDWEIMLFRGSTHLRLGFVEAIDHVSEALPSNYPEVATVDLPYEKTYLVNHAKSVQDFKAARYKVKFCFIIMPEDGPFVALNEFNVSLLGIHQVYPLRAMFFEPAGLLVGKEDIDEFTSYANTQDGSKAGVAHSLMFGVFVTQTDGKTKAWTKGLHIFSHPEFVMEVEDIDPMACAQTLYNSGCYVTQGGRYQSGETMSTGTIFCSIEEEANQSLKLVPA